MIEPAAVRFHDVWFSYGEPVTLEAVSFQVPQGAFAALIGPNGAGKTTALKLMLGLIMPDSGHIRIFGSAPGRQRESIGYIPQKVMVPRGFPLTVEELVVMGRYGRIGLGRYPGKGDREAAMRALERVELDRLGSQRFCDLSGGQQQRALIARALVGDPKLLLLDEATGGLDPAAREAFYNLCCELQREAGMTLLASSHDMEAVGHHADTVILLNRAVLAVGSADEVLSLPVLRRAYRFPARHGAPQHEHRPPPPHRR